MIGWLEAVVVPVASELLRGFAVSAVRLFRDPTEKDEEAREEPGESGRLFEDRREGEK